jgi:Uma2 family endonuclease
MAQAESLAITVHDYMSMPPGPPYHQLIEGDLHMSPSPHWRHQDVALNIATLIKNHLREHDTGRVYISPMDLALNDTNVYQPDVFFFRHHSNAKRGDRCIEGAPDFVVEILSDSTAHLDQLKRKIYARFGVKELWFIDTELKQITVLDLPKSAEKPAATYSARDQFTSKTFPGLSFSGAEIFRGI